MSIPRTLIAGFIGLASCGDMVASDSEIIVAHRSRSAQGRVHFITTFHRPRNREAAAAHTGSTRSPDSAAPAHRPDDRGPWARYGRTGDPLDSCPATQAWEGGTLPGSGLCMTTD